MVKHRWWTGTSVRALLAGSAAALLAIGAVACGGDDESSTTSSSSSSSSAAPAGDPIKVLIQAPVEIQGGGNASIPNALNVGKAYETYINDKGGIKGRPLEVVTCDDHQVTQDSVNCARQAASEKAVAAVGGTTYYGPNVMPIYEQNKIAWFGAACNLSPDEFTVSVSFPTATCSIPIIAGDVLALYLQGCKSIAFTNYAIAVGETQAKLVENSSKSLGISGATVTIPQLQVPDVTPYVARAAKDTDCVFAGSLTTPQNFEQWMTVWQQQGHEQKLAFNAGVLAPQVLAKFPEQIEGAVMANTASSLSLPVWDDYKAATKAAGVPEGDNSRAQVTWASLVAFTKIAESIDGEIDNETFLEAANSTSDLDMEGLQANLDFTQTFTGFGGGYPRMFNRQVAISIVQNGELTAYENGKFFDTTNLIDGTPYEG